MKRRRGYTRVSTKNQITIPADVLREAGLRPGDELKVVADNGHIVLEPALSLVERQREALRQIAGKYRGVYPPGSLDEVRDEWEERLRERER